MRFDIGWSQLHAIGNGKGEVKTMKDLITEIVLALVDQPDQVSVTQNESGHTVMLEIRVANSDLGKVIGKKGRNAYAIRTILSAVGGKTRKRYVLEIVEWAFFEFQPLPNLQSYLLISKPVQKVTYLSVNGGLILVGNTVVCPVMNTSSNTDKKMMFWMEMPRFQIVPSFISSSWKTLQGLWRVHIRLFGAGFVILPSRITDVTFLLVPLENNPRLQQPR